MKSLTPFEANNPKILIKELKEIDMQTDVSYFSLD
jgi:hypothetical protein